MAGMGLGIKLGCLDTIPQVVGSQSRGESRGKWVEGAGGPGIVGLNQSARTVILNKAEGLPKVTELVAT